MNHRKRAQARPSGSAHGVLILDKPRGPTSHDVVAIVRRVFGTRRVGHAGTLDPMATGVLVVLLGEATKLSSVLTTERKVYEAEITFGSATDSLDAEGKVTTRQTLSPGWLSDSILHEALRRERGRTSQMPPQVSAIKVDGQRAYALARKGQSAPLTPRSVQVHELELLAKSDERLRVRVEVSKGFYVRSLARDLGDGLKVPAHLSALRRIASGPFTIAQAQSFPPDADTELLSLEEAASSSLPTLEVTQEGALRLSQGKPVFFEHLTKPPDLLPTKTGFALWAAFFEDRILALVEQRKPMEFRVKRGIVTTKAASQGLHDPSPGR